MLQEVYKLIVKANYWKKVQKTIETETENVYGEEAAKIITENCDVLNDDKALSYCDLFQMKYLIATPGRFSLTLIGVITLSMYKPLMDLVIYFLEDIELHVFYQDTDSKNIYKGEVPITAVKFEKKYGYPLIGSHMS